jgi:hypothetical protein
MLKIEIYNAPLEVTNSGEIAVFLHHCGVDNHVFSFNQLLGLFQE